MFQGVSKYNSKQAIFHKANIPGSGVATAFVPRGEPEFFLFFFLFFCPFRAQNNRNVFPKTKDKNVNLKERGKTCCPDGTPRTTLPCPATLLTRGISNSHRWEKHSERFVLTLPTARRGVPNWKGRLFKMSAPYVFTPQSRSGIIRFEQSRRREGGWGGG